LNFKQVVETTTVFIKPPRRVPTKFPSPNAVESKEPYAFLTSCSLSAGKTPAKFSSKAGIPYGKINAPPMPPRPSPTNIQYS